MTTNTAAEQYTHLCQIAEEQAQSIAAALGDHLGISPEMVDWGDVGSVNHAIGELKDIIRFLRIKETSWQKTRMPYRA